MVVVSVDVTDLLPVPRELPVETERLQTQLHQSNNQEHYTYTNVPWRLYLRKEVPLYTGRTYTETHATAVTHTCQSLKLPPPSPYAPDVGQRQHRYPSLTAGSLRESTGLQGAVNW